MGLEEVHDCSLATGHRYGFTPLVQCVLLA